MKSVALFSILSLFTLASVAMIIQKPLGTKVSEVIIPNEYIVVLKPNVDVQNYLKSFQEFHASAEVMFEYSFGFSYKVNGDDYTSAEYYEQLQQDPNVDIIEQNKLAFASEVQVNPPSWGLTRIWQTTYAKFREYQYPESAGENVDVYVADTGIYLEHEDFQGRAKFGFSAIDDEADDDFNGHGTFCASVVGGLRRGVAKKANLIAVKVLAGDGSGSYAGIIAGVDYIVKAVGASKKPSVVNMSLGGPKSAALDRAMSTASKAGIIFAVAAGNSADDACNYSPANSEDVITVGATAPFDEIAYFSNYGKCVDLFAPGTFINGAIAGAPNVYTSGSGTSFASPHVAGVIALALQNNTFTPAEMKLFIQETALKGAVKDLPANTANYLLYSKPPTCRETLASCQ